MVLEYIYYILLFVFRHGRPQGGAKGAIAPTGNFCFKTIVNLIPRILIIT
jgi:hypothetical protein